MPLLDPYVVTLKSRIGAVEVRQDFAYQVTLTAGGDEAYQLAFGFWNWLEASGINTVVANNTTFYGVSVRNLYYPTVFHELGGVTPVTGIHEGNKAPTFLCVSFKSNKPAYGQRPARKRFGGLTEDLLNGDYITGGAGYPDMLDNFAVALGDFIQTGGTPATYQFEPVVVKRVKYVTADDKVAYRYPQSAEEADIFQAVIWSWDEKVTTQNTRKLGRGM